MNELRNGINTRLQSKENFDSMRSQFINTRANQYQQIIKPINQDDFLNFHSFANEYESYSIRDANKKNVNDEFEKYYESKEANEDIKSDTKVVLFLVIVSVIAATYWVAIQ